MKRFFWIVLLAISTLWISFGLRNYTVYAHSDLRAFLFPARDFAAGHYPMHYPLYDLLDKGVEPKAREYYDPYFQRGRDDRLVTFVGHGYPLLLGGLIRLFGLGAPFLLNSLLLGLLPLLLAWLAWKGLRDAAAPERRNAALAVALATWLIPLQVVGVHLSPYRDLCQFSLILLAMGLLAGAGRRPAGAALCAGILLGYAAWVRDSALFVAPAMLAYLLFENGRRGPERLGRIVVFLLGLGLGLIPAMRQGFLDRGAGLQIAPVLVQQATEFLRGGGDFSFTRIAAQAWRYGQNLFLQPLGWIGGVLLAVLAFGFLRRPAWTLMLLLAAGAYFAANMSGLKSWTRYQLPVFLFVLPLVGAAFQDVSSLLARGLQRWPRLARGFPAGLLLLLALATLPNAWRLIRADSRSDRWSVSDARQFETALRHVLRPGDLVLAEGVLQPLTEYFSPAPCVTMGSLDNARHNLPEAVARVWAAGGRVFFFQAELVHWQGRVWEYPFHPADARQHVLENFDLLPRRPFRPNEFNLHYYFGGRPAALCELAPWTSRILRLNVPVSAPGPYVLRVNLRAQPPGDLMLAGPAGAGGPVGVGPGWNYIPVPDSWVSHGCLRVELRSERPLPADVAPEVLGRYSEAAFVLGMHRAPPDRLFFPAANIRRLDPPDIGRMLGVWDIFRLPVYAPSGGWVRILGKVQPLTAGATNGLWRLRLGGAAWTNPRVNSQLEFLLPAAAVTTSGAQEVVLERLNPFTARDTALQEWLIQPLASEFKLDTPRAGFYRVREYRRENDSIAGGAARVQHVATAGAPLIFQAGHTNLLLGAPAWLGNQSLTGDFSEDGVFGFEGFYPREQEGPRAWRWTAGTSTLWLPALTNAPLHVRLLVSHNRPADAPRPRLTIQSEGRTVADAAVTNNQMLVQFTIQPTQLIRGQTRLDFTADTWQPSSADPRHLGVCLDGVEADYDP